MNDLMFRMLVKVIGEQSSTVKKQKILVIGGIDLFTSLIKQ